MEPGTPRVRKTTLPIPSITEGKRILIATPEMLYRTRIATPIGRMVALASKRGLCALEFDRPERMALLTRRLARWHGPHAIKEANHPILALTKHWLRDYFKGRFGNLKTPPFDIRGTAFEKRVWGELMKLKPGRVLSYARMAKELGKPRAARAVGGASARNPVAIIIPCHRLVGSNGSLNGYGGGLDKKRWLLEQEKAIRL
jgi:methylated-DNA-[protein]-cysteine S-methyltransferase